jgi:hypothetical protein
MRKMQVIVLCTLFLLFSPLWLVGFLWGVGVDMFTFGRVTYLEIRDSFRSR